MINKIKDWFFYREMNQTAKKRTSRATGINLAQRINILFDGTDEEDRKTVHKFKKQLNPNQKKTVKSLAFVNNDLPLDNVDYAAYNKKNLKWYGVPFGNKVVEFTACECDLMIVLSKNMLKHFEYIIAHSEAAFIVGPAIEHAEDYFDLIIDFGETGNLEMMIKELVSGIDTVATK